MPRKTEIVKCPECGRRFPDNPDKHTFRNKYSPCCRAVYKKSGMHLPEFSLRWIREKLENIEWAKNLHDQQLRGKATHSASLNLEEGEILTESRIEKEFQRLKFEEEQEKEARKSRWRV